MCGLTERGGTRRRFERLLAHWGHELRDSALDCASPLALFDGLGAPESARGLAQSKTLRRFGRLMENGSRVTFDALRKSTEPGQQP